MADTTQARTRWFHLTPGRFVIGLLAVEVLLWLSERFGWLGWHKGYAVLTCVASVGVAMLLTLAWFGVALVMRWRFQFSLRPLLAMVVVVALPCSWLAVEMKKTKKQREAINLFVASHNHVVLYDGETDDEGNWIRGPAVGPLTRLLEWNCFRTATSINLVCYSVGQPRPDTEPDVAHAMLLALNDMPDLRSLDLGIRVNDSDLEYIAPLKKLRGLDLSGQQVTDAGLKHLIGLRDLNRLRLGGTKVSDAGLHDLEGLPQLQSLDLWATQVTAAGVAKFQQALPNCKITR